MHFLSILGGIKNYRERPASDCFGNKLKQDLRHLPSRELLFET